jgi:hypothetical protein
MTKQLQGVLKDLIQGGIDDIFLSANLKLEIEAVEAEIDQRVLALIPEGGWEGKNEAERKNSKDRALAADTVYQQLQAKLKMMQENKVIADASVDAISLKLRCIDIFIRDQVNVLAGGASASEIVPSMDEDGAADDFNAPGASEPQAEIAVPSEIGKIIADPLDAILPRPVPEDDLPF